MKNKFPEMHENDENINLNSNEKKQSTFETLKNYIKFGKQEEEIPEANLSCMEKVKKKLKSLIEVETNYTFFFVLLFAGLGIMMLSFMLLPYAMFKPQKFIMMFSLGSFLIMISFIFIYGTTEYLKILFNSNRYYLTLLYLSSIAIGIYFSFYSQLYFIAHICAVFQLISIVTFALSFIPGGSFGIQFIFNAIKSPFSSLWMRITGSSYLPQ